MVWINVNARGISSKMFDKFTDTLGFLPDMRGKFITRLSESNKCWFALTVLDSYWNVVGGPAVTCYLMTCSLTSDCVREVTGERCPKSTAGVGKVSIWGDKKYGELAGPSSPDDRQRAQTQSLPSFLLPHPSPQPLPIQLLPCPLPHCSPPHFLLPHIVVTPGLNKSDLATDVAETIESTL